MNYKNIMLPLVFLFLLTACGSDDSENDTSGNPNVNLTKLVDKKIYTNPEGVINELKYTYNSDNNLTRIDADTYYKTYTYSGDIITKVESIDLPNSPYYTIEFSYNSNGTIEYTKRINHYNNTLMIVTYEYTGDLVISCCIYDSQELFDLRDCKRRYYMRYETGSRNFDEKDLFIVAGLSQDLLETTQWIYDTNEKPYFGEAIDKINLPYVTSGIEIDYEYVYNTNNPLKRDIIMNTGEVVLSKVFEYTYDDEGYPKNMIIKQYNRNTGELLSTIQNDFIYIEK